MMLKKNCYATAARLLAYPRESYFNDVSDCLDSLKPFLSHSLNQRIDSYIELIKRMSLGQLEELYTSTFDINGRCCLDVGYLMFGEDYKRGEFLVQLNQVHRQYENQLGTELGDHLCNMLNLLSSCDDHEFKKDLVLNIMIPAVEKMLGAFSGNSEHLFVFPLEVICQILQVEFQGERVSV